MASGICRAHQSLVRIKVDQAQRCDNYRSDEILASCELNVFFVFFGCSNDCKIGCRCFNLRAIPFSRVVEIGYAFYNDALDQLEGFKPRSGLAAKEKRGFPAA